MLNLSEVITAIKMDIGIYGMVLPFDNGDQALMDVIKIQTIPVFSIYAPYRLIVPIKKEELEQIDRQNDWISYRLPNIFGDRKIITIEEVRPMSIDHIGYGTDYSICDYKGMMVNSVYASMAHYASPKMSFDFREPNVLTLFNAGVIANGIVCEMGLSHDSSLATIDEGHRVSFLKLALLDVKKFLFNAMRNYDEIQTAYGTIKLRTDEWSGAEGDRVSLLEKWDDTAHLGGRLLHYA